MKLTKLMFAVQVAAGLFFGSVGFQSAGAQSLPYCPDVPGTYYTYGSIAGFLRTAIENLPECNKTSEGWPFCKASLDALLDADTAITQMLAHNSEEINGERCLKDCRLDKMIGMASILKFLAPAHQELSGQRNSMENTYLIMMQHKDDPLCRTVSSAHASIGGKWNTTEGAMSLSDVTAGNFRGGYNQDSGRVLGALQGGKATGNWIEAGSDEECTSAFNGSRHWGRFVWSFSAEYDSFTGLWGYCNKTPSKPWNGTKAQ